MAFDEDLANRIRDLLARERGLSEKRMFGGLAFLVGPFEMRGRPLDGWLRVDIEGVRTKRQLASWVERGVAYARTLPSKESRSPRAGRTRP
jgi:hypothetical protein